MRFTLALSTLSLVGLALAQNTNNTVVTIQVGSTSDAPGGIFQFIPNSVTATNGTVINFQFIGMPGNHSITQSTFASPCTPRVGGFDSGWVYLPTPGLTPIPQWNLTIEDDTTPIWFFCKQLLPGPHCISGMVGAINAPTTGNTFDSYRQAATSFTGQVPQNQNGLVGVGASASIRPDPIPSGATAFPTGTNISPVASGPGPASNPSSTPTPSGAITFTASVSSAIIAVMAGITSVFVF